MGYGTSSFIIKWVNFLTLGVSVCIVGAGIWLGTKHGECERFLTAPVIALGALVFIISSLGFIGAWKDIACLLWIYLAIMFFLLAGLALFTVFAFVITNDGAGHFVSGQGFKEYRLGDYSEYIQKALKSSGNWKHVRACLLDPDYCADLGRTYRSVTELVSGQLNPIQSGCCRPPAECKFPMVNVTYYNLSSRYIVSPQSANPSYNVPSPPSSNATISNTTNSPSNPSPSATAPPPPPPVTFNPPPLVKTITTSWSSLEQFFVQGARETSIYKHYADPDCITYENDPAVKCFECESCKAGVAQYIKKDWRLIAIINIAVFLFLTALYIAGCCARRNASRAQYTKMLKKRRKAAQKEVELERKTPPYTSRRMAIADPSDEELEDGNTSRCWLTPLSDAPEDLAPRRLAFPWPSWHRTTNLERHKSTSKPLASNHSTEADNPVNTSHKRTRQPDETKGKTHVKSTMTIPFSPNPQELTLLQYTNPRVRVASSPPSDGGTVAGLEASTSGSSDHAQNPQVHATSLPDKGDNTSRQPPENGPETHPRQQQDAKSSKCSPSTSCWKRPPPKTMHTNILFRGLQEAEHDNLLFEGQPDKSNIRHEDPAGGTDCAMLPVSHNPEAPRPAEEPGSEWCNLRPGKKQKGTPSSLQIDASSSEPRAVRVPGRGVEPGTDSKMKSLTQAADSSNIEQQPRREGGIGGRDLEMKLVDKQAATTDQPHGEKSNSHHSGVHDEQARHHETTISHGEDTLNSSKAQPAAVHSGTQEHAPERAHVDDELDIDHSRNEETVEDEPEEHRLVLRRRHIAVTPPVSDDNNQNIGTADRQEPDTSIGTYELAARHQEEAQEASGEEQGSTDSDDGASNFRPPLKMKRVVDDHAEKEERDSSQAASSSRSHNDSDPPRRTSYPQSSAEPERGSEHVREEKVEPRTRGGWGWVNERRKKKKEEEETKQKAARFFNI